MRLLFCLFLCGCTCLTACKPAAPSPKASAGVEPTRPETKTAQKPAPRPASLKHVSLPEGFEITYYAQGVEGARSMARGPKGTLFVGTRKLDRVYALTDTDQNGSVDKVRVIATGLRSPNGVAVKDGALYVAEVHRVLRFDAIEDRLDAPPEPVVVKADFPTDANHGWKHIAFGPDGKLYVPVGAPCNVCAPEDPVYSTITRMNPDGSDFEIYAHGIRNTVGFTWHPQTKQLWFTDNGRDMMGDDIPPDELNVAPKRGMHFGFPYCHGSGLLDPKFGDKEKCAASAKPVRNLGPHVAALGVEFYTGDMFPDAYTNRIFIAEHGSWNRSTPIGYRVTMVHKQQDGAWAYEPFATGWLGDDGTKRGRPVDLLVMPDGALLVSDDMAGAIYRIAYNKGG